MPLVCMQTPVGASQDGTPTPFPDVRVNSGNRPLSSQKLQTLCLCTLTLIALAWALYWLRQVMVPLVLAQLLSYILQPII